MFCLIDVNLKFLCIDLALTFKMTRVYFINIFLLDIEKQISIQTEEIYIKIQGFNCAIGKVAFAPFIIIYRIATYRVKYSKFKNKCFDELPFLEF